VGRDQHVGVKWLSETCEPNCYRKSHSKRGAYTRCGRRLGIMRANPFKNQYIPYEATIDRL
jgi:hypothetical protein